MKLGFAVYFLAVALAPLTCYGVWVHVSLWAESLTYSQALALLESYYQGGLLRGLDVAGFDVTGFDLHLLLRHWDWPNWLSLSAVGEFITAPEAFVQAAADGASGLAYSPADLGVSDLFDGAEQLLKLHSVLAFAKPIMATLLTGWLWAAAQLQGLGPALMVSFGDCTPQQKELQQLEARNKARTKMEAAAAPTGLKVDLAELDARIELAKDADVDLEAVERAIRKLQEARALQEMQKLQARGFAQGSSYQLQEAKTRQEVKSLQARMQGSYHSGSYLMSLGRGP